MMTSSVTLPARRETFALPIVQSIDYVDGLG
jgi:hypothetical protein